MQDREYLGRLWAVLAMIKTTKHVVDSEEFGFARANTST